MTAGSVIPPSRPSRSREELAPLVLAIDDHCDNLLVLQYALTAFGFRVIGETDAIAGLTRLQQDRPDLILLDIMMPGMDGIEFVEIMQKQPSLSHIPVIAVTGLASDKDRTRILQAGFADYICKPFMLEDLEAAIRHHVPWPACSNRTERVLDC